MLGIKVWLHSNSPPGLSHTVPVTTGDEQEYRLTRYLMANYDASVRPAKNSSEALSVVFGVSLHSIIDVVSRLPRSL